MKKILLFAPVCVLFFCHIAYASTDHLWINQVQTTGGPGKTTNDFVEIYNPTNTDIDLNGIRLVKRTQAGTSDTLLKSWTDSVIVKAGGYYLWANSDFTDIAVIPDVATSGSLADDNGVALRQGPNDTGTIIDSVAWGNSTNAFVEGSVFATNPQANQALGRTQDTDNNAADFSLSDPSPHNSSSSSSTNPTPTPSPSPSPSPDPAPTPTPSPTPSPAPAPTPTPAPSPIQVGSAQPQYSTAVTISEFLPNPDGADAGSEWVELYNSSSVEVDLSGWILDDEGTAGTVGSSAYVLPAASIINAASFLVVDLPDGVFALDNTGGDAVRLIWPDKQTANEVDYTDTAPIDASYARKVDNTFAWTSLVTKGSVNQFQTPVSSSGTEHTTTQSADVPADATVKQLPDVVINELFPEPARASTQEEFIELFNAGQTDADLIGFKISDSATSYKLDSKLATGEYLVIPKSESNISLNNSGTEKVTLTDASGDIVDTVSYTDAPKEESYNLTPNDTYIWSTKLTPGQLNKISNEVISNQIQPAGAGNGIVLASSQDNSVPPAADSSDVLVDGQVSGAEVAQTSQSATPVNLWPWLISSFVINLLFCYILVRLMMRKEKI